MKNTIMNMPSDEISFGNIIIDNVVFLQNTNVIFITLIGKKYENIVINRIKFVQMLKSIT
jgi:hypothetical protein